MRLTSIQTACPLFFLFMGLCHSRVLEGRQYDTVVAANANSAAVIADDIPLNNNQGQVLTSSNAQPNLITNAQYPQATQNGQYAQNTAYAQGSPAYAANQQAIACPAMRSIVSNTTSNNARYRRATSAPTSSVPTRRPSGPPAGYNPPINKATIPDCDPTSFVISGYFTHGTNLCKGYCMFNPAKFSSCNQLAQSYGYISNEDWQLFQKANDGTGNCEYWNAGQCTSTLSNPICMPSAGYARATIGMVILIFGLALAI